MLLHSPARPTTRLAPHLAARLAVALVLALSACATPQGDQATPKGAHYATLQARVAGDGDGLWALLAPQDRALFDRLVAIDREGAHLTTVSYPADRRSQALAAFPARAFSSGHALFVSLVGTPGPLGLGARVGARVRHVEQDGDEATVKTWGGDTLRYVRGPDGKWYCTLYPDERAVLTARVDTAQTNLATLKTQIKRLLNP